MDGAKAKAPEVDIDAWFRQATDGASDGPSLLDGIDPAALIIPAIGDKAQKPTHKAISSTTSLLNVGGVLTIEAPSDPNLDLRMITPEERRRELETKKGELEETIKKLPKAEIEPEVDNLSLIDLQTIISLLAKNTQNTVILELAKEINQALEAMFRSILADTDVDELNSQMTSILQRTNEFMTKAGNSVSNTTLDELPKNIQDSLLAMWVVRKERREENNIRKHRIKLMMAIPQIVDEREDFDPEKRPEGLITGEIRDNK